MVINEEMEIEAPIKAHSALTETNQQKPNQPIEVQESLLPHKQASVLIPKTNNDKDKQSSSMSVSLNLKSLNDDFIIPSDGNWVREKIMGQGAYGKVMECYHKTSGFSFAVKRFDDIFKD